MCWVGDGGAEECDGARGETVPRSTQFAGHEASSREVPQTTTSMAARFPASEQPPTSLPDAATKECAQLVLCRALTQLHRAMGGHLFGLYDLTASVECMT